MASIQNNYPSLQSGWVLLIYVTVPWIPILIGVHIVKEERHTQWRGGLIYSWIRNFALFLYVRAPLVAIGQIIWLALLTLNQGSYLYSHMDWQRTPLYYTSVNLFSHNALQAINNAMAETSYNAITAAATGNMRRLQTQVDSTLTLAYHTNGWDDLLSSNYTYLQQVCQTENGLLASGGGVNCFDNQWQSIISQIFDDQCNFLSPMPDIDAIMALSDNSRYVADTLTSGSGETPVILSYFDPSLTLCLDQDPSDFEDQVNAYAVGDIHVSYTAVEMNQQEIKGYVFNSLYYLMIACIIAYILLAIGVRGLLVPVVVAFCAFFAAINAAALLPLLGFRYFSIYNGPGVLIMIAYACDTVMTYSAAWRKQVRPGAHPTAGNIVKAFVRTVPTVYYVTFVSQICLYSLMISPVLAVKQFGAFTGLAIASFFLAFHYVIIPCWILTTHFKLSKKFHRRLRKSKRKYCGCLEHLEDYAPDGWGAVHAMQSLMAIHHPGLDSESSESSEDSEDSEHEPSVVPADHVHYVGEVATVDGSQMGDNDRRARDNASVAESEVVSVAAVQVDLAEEPSQRSNHDDHHPNEMQTETGICRGKRPLKILGLLVVMLVVICLIIVYVLSLPDFQVNVSIPKLSTQSSNINNILYIGTNYKYDFLESHTPSQLVISSTSSSAPTRTPTASPSSHSPTMAPTQTPTVFTSNQPTSVNSDEYVDYSVLGCWGIAIDKGYIDDTTSFGVNYYTFQNYVKDNAAVSDFQRVCDYVDSNRGDLSLNPSWSVDECIYEQYATVLDTIPVNLQSDTSYVWQVFAQQTYTAGMLVGMLSNSTSTAAQPIWVCSNFSLRSYVPTINNHEDVILDVQREWQKVFDDYATQNADSYGIPVLVTSSAFTYPVLNYRLKQYDMRVVVACVLISFSLLLWVFTLGDFGLSFFGTMGVFTILSVVICLYIYFVSKLLDQYDLMMITAVMVVLVDFPMQLIVEYMAMRAFVHRQTAVRIDKALSPALAVTNKHVRRALLVPLVLIIGIALPVAFAELVSFQRIAQYLIVVALISFIFTVFVEPYLLAFGCRTRFCERLRHLEDDDDEQNTHSDGGSEAGNANAAATTAVRAGNANNDPRGMSGAMVPANGGSVVLGASNYPRGPYGPSDLDSRSASSGQSPPMMNRSMSAIPPQPGIQLQPLNSMYRPMPPSQPMQSMQSMQPGGPAPMMPMSRPMPARPMPSMYMQGPPQQQVPPPPQFVPAPMPTGMAPITRHHTMQPMPMQQMSMQHHMSMMPMQQRPSPPPQMSYPLRGSQSYYPPPRPMGSPPYYG